MNYAFQSVAWKAHSTDMKSPRFLFSVRAGVKGRSNKSKAARGFHIMGRRNQILVADENGPRVQMSTRGVQKVLSRSSARLIMHSIRVRLHHTQTHTVVDLLCGARRVLYGGSGNNNPSRWPLLRNKAFLLNFMFVMLREGGSEKYSRRRRWKKSHFHTC